MLFTSPIFITFLCLFFILIKNQKIDKIFLINIFSCIFYGAWNPFFLLLLFFTTVVDFHVALLMERTEQQKRRKLLVLISIVANLSILGFFKYGSLISQIINDSLGLFSINHNIPYLNLILPVGISFYTFQTMSYTIDVYRKNIHAENKFAYFFCYVSFFPQLIAGPIERVSSLLPQLKKLHCKKDFYFSNVTQGVELIIRGYIKKVIFADNFSPYVNSVFQNLSAYDRLTIFEATLFFRFQIYADFSGYTDIARGIARCLGIELSANFNYPYFAKDISDFWKRWHITLSTWLKDYLYIPLGGNRHGNKQMYRNLILTMVLGGLWHGASYNFIIWGTYHGLALSIHKYWSSKKFIKIPNLVSYIITFSTILFSWFIFRVESLNDLLLILSYRPHLPFLAPPSNAIFLLFIMISTQLIENLYLKKRISFMSFNYYTRLAIFSALGLLFILNQPPSDQSFIYFQF